MLLGLGRLALRSQLEGLYKGGKWGSPDFMLENETPDPGLVLPHEFHDLMAQGHSSSVFPFLLAELPGAGWPDSGYH